MHTYCYDGPVLEFEKVVANRWTSRTRAVSEKTALCNFAYQFKTQNNRVANVKITLPGKITMVE
jgi:hypothetical protein